MLTPRPRRLNPERQMRMRRYLFCRGMATAAHKSRTIVRHHGCWRWWFKCDCSLSILPGTGSISPFER